MNQTTESPRDTALRYARTAAEAFADNAAFIRTLQDDDWSGPTGASEWDMRRLEGHIIGEGVWFPHLVLEVAKGEPPLPGEIWGELAELPGDQMADRLEAGAATFVPNVESATDDELQHEADLGWMKMPLYRALYIGVLEGVYHNWDARVGKDPDVTIPTPWAVALAADLHTAAGFFAHRKALAAGAGSYLLEVGDGVGPIWIDVSESGATCTPGRFGDADVTLTLSADAYVRLLAGRLKLERELDRGAVQLRGNRDRAIALTRVFGGIANE